MSHNWKGKDWQCHVNILLCHHFATAGLRYQRVPDGVAGDGGMEGVSSDGQGFQAYADEDSNSKKERAEKQKNKMKEDLDKLITNRDQWSKRLQSKKLHSWTLMVPICEDKGVLDYAASQARRIRKEGLPFVSSDFQVFVQQDSDFPVALQQITTAATIKLRLDAASVGAADILDFEKKNSEQVETMDRKLLRVASLRTPADRLAARKDYLKRFLYRDNLLQDLLVKHRLLREKIDEHLTWKGEQIVTEGRLEETPANQRVLKVQKELSAELGDELPALSTRNRADIAWGTVAWWLINCNLDFPEIVA